MLNWQHELSFLDKDNHGTESRINRRLLMVRLLLAMLWTANAGDSDDAQPCQKSTDVGVLYGHISKALKYLGADYIHDTMSINGEYTFNVDAPKFYNVHNQIEWRLRDAEDIGFDCAHRTLYISWDGCNDVESEWYKNEPDAYCVSVDIFKGMNTEAAARRACDTLAEMQKQNQN